MTYDKAFFQEEAERLLPDESVAVVYKSDGPIEGAITAVARHRNYTQEEKRAFRQQAIAQPEILLATSYSHDLQQTITLMERMRQPAYWMKYMLDTDGALSSQREHILLLDFEDTLKPLVENFTLPNHFPLSIYDRNTIYYYLFANQFAKIFYDKQTGTETQVPMSDGHANDPEALRAYLMKENLLPETRVAALSAVDLEIIAQRAQNLFSAVLTAKKQGKGINATLDYFGKLRHLANIRAFTQLGVPDQEKIAAHALAAKIASLPETELTELAWAQNPKDLMRLSIKQASEKYQRVKHFAGVLRYLRVKGVFNVTPSVRIHRAMGVFADARLQPEARPAAAFVSEMIRAEKFFFDIWRDKIKNAWGRAHRDLVVARFNFTQALYPWAKQHMKWRWLSRAKVG